jgi:hypothetical protein
VYSDKEKRDNEFIYVKDEKSMRKKPRRKGNQKRKKERK